MTYFPAYIILILYTFIQTGDSSKRETKDGSGFWANSIDEYDFEYFGKEAFEPSDDLYKDLINDTELQQSSTNIVHLPTQNDKTSNDDLSLDFFPLPDELEPILPGGSKFDDISENRTQSGCTNIALSNHILQYSVLIIIYILFNCT